MSERPIKFQYQEGIVSGGYSFSAYSNVITLPGYVEKLENPKIREAIQYEAETARALYVEEIKRLKANGEKANSFIVKRDAIRMAKEQAQAKYADVWKDVEATGGSPPRPSEKAVTEPERSSKDSILHLSVVVLPQSSGLLERVAQTMKTHDTEVDDNS